MGFVKQKIEEIKKFFCGAGPFVGRRRRMVFFFDFFFHSVEHVRHIKAIIVPIHLIIVSPWNNAVKSPSGRLFRRKSP